MYRGAGHFCAGAGDATRANASRASNSFPGHFAICAIVPLSSRPLMIVPQVKKIPRPSELHP